MRKPLKSKNPIQIIKAALRFLAAYIVLSALLHGLSPFYCNALLPLWRLGMERMLPFEVTSATTRTTTRDHSLKLFAEFKKPVFINKKDKVVVAYLNTGLALGYLNGYPLIAFSLLAAWPGLSPRQKIISSMVITALVLSVFVIEPPLYVICDLEANHLKREKINPDEVPELKGTANENWIYIGDEFNSSPFRHYMAVYAYWVLTSGGHQVLALGIFAVSILPYYIRKGEFYHDRLFTDRIGSV